MLIKSQDKLTIISLDDFTIETDNEDTYDGTYAIYICKPGISREIGHYSTKEKAIKVMNMIQEAYTVYESNRIVSIGLAATAYVGSYDTKESITHGVKVIKEYAKTLESMTIFQMPEDSEVEE